MMKQISGNKQLSQKNESTIMQELVEIKRV